MYRLSGYGIACEPPHVGTSKKVSRVAAYPKNQSGQGQLTIEIQVQPMIPGSDIITVYVYRPSIRLRVWSINKSPFTGRNYRRHC